MGGAGRDGADRWRGAGAGGKAAALALVLVVLWLALAAIPSDAELPVGCDDFGYQRQAQLFRERGLAGFDTQLSSPAARRLLAMMRDSGAPASAWYQAVAPHCHHYKPATGVVVLQYPPGTGAVMAVLPRAGQSRTLRMTGVVLLAAILAIAVGGATSTAAIWIGAGATALALHGATVGSDSVAIGSAAAAATGLLMVPALERRSAAWLLSFGIVAGLAASFRITNLAFGAAAGLALLWMAIRQRRRRDLTGLIVLSVGLAIGLAPLLWANFINAGSPIATTYSPVDAAAPRFGVAWLLRGIVFYSGVDRAAPLLAGALGLGSFAFAARPRSTALAAMAIAMSVSLAYLLPKQILIPYYLTPVSIFAIATVLGHDVFGAGATPHRAGAAALSLSVLVCGGLLIAAAAHRAPAIESADHARSADAVDTTVARALAADPIVWADFQGGRFVMERNAYAAKLSFASPEMQDYMVAGLARMGQSQLLVTDTDATKAIFRRVSRRWPMRRLGTAFGHDVYAIGAAPAP